jgi:hypothetical protein
MFGLPTIPKLLIIAAIIAVVLYFIRRGKVAKAESGQSGSRSAGAPKAGTRAQKPVEELVQCKSCGAYFAAKSGCSCGQH